MTSNPTKKFQYVGPWMTLLSTYNHIKTAGSSSDSISSCPYPHWRWRTVRTKYMCIILSCGRPWNTDNESRIIWMYDAPNFPAPLGKFLVPIGKQSYTYISLVILMLLWSRTNGRTSIDLDLQTSHWCITRVGCGLVSSCDMDLLRSPRSGAPISHLWWYETCLIQRV